MRRLPPHAVAVFLAALALGGCGLLGHRHTAGDDATAVLFSPNGEALSGGPLGHPSCQDAFLAWFERTDTNHDGVIDRREYLADARRQFAEMDLDHDGVITPAELSRYRYPYAAGAEARQRAEAADGGRGDRAAASSGDLPDPVMAADVDLRNRVTLGDFLTYEEGEFATLDKSGTGRLSKADILSLCK